MFHPQIEPKSKNHYHQSIIITNSLSSSEEYHLGLSKKQKYMSIIIQSTPYTIKTDFWTDNLQISYILDKIVLLGLTQRG